MADIEAELAERLADLEGRGKLLEAQRLRMRTVYDLEMMREVGYCSGIENYSRHIDGRGAGEPPYTLLDYFPEDFLTVVDESHVTIPQLHGQFEGDRSRKAVLVEHGFRLPSAADNRPLRFDEWLERTRQAVFLSATPARWELEHSAQVVEQIIRPTGLVDPEVVVKPTRGQIDDLLEQIHRRCDAGQRVLVTTLTKKMAEDLTDYLLETGVRARYLHSEVQTLERVQILRDLRLGEFDVLVGINLLREGLDLPEVGLVAILDADKEGFLRSETSLVQTIGRAARNVEGQVIMYADDVTDSMRRAISETNRRRALQMEFNAAHGIDPQTIRKKVVRHPGAGAEPGRPGGRPAQAAGGPPARPGPARRRPGPAHPQPRGGDAGGRPRAALRVRRPPARRGHGVAAGAEGDGRGGVVSPSAYEYARRGWSPAPGRPGGAGWRRTTPSPPASGWCCPRRRRGSPARPTTSPSRRPCASAGSTAGRALWTSSAGCSGTARGGPAASGRRSTRPGWRGCVEAGPAWRPPGWPKVEAAQADGSWEILDRVDALEMPEDLAAALRRGARGSRRASPDWRRRCASQCSTGCCRPSGPRPERAGSPPWWRRPPRAAPLRRRTRGRAACPVLHSRRG